MMRYAFLMLLCLVLLTVFMFMCESALKVGNTAVDRKVLEQSHQSRVRSKHDDI